MSNREESLLLNDILDPARKILNFTKGMDVEQFLEDEKTQDACIRNFEIMGEASKYVTEETKLSNPEIEWRKISNYRNLLIHEYFGVNLEIVWDIIENEMSETVYLLENLVAKRED